MRCLQARTLHLTLADLNQVLLLHIDISTYDVICEQNCCFTYSFVQHLIDGSQFFSKTK